MDGCMYLFKNQLSFSNMYCFKILLSIALWVLPLAVFSQIRILGRVLGSEDQPLVGATIALNEQLVLTTSDLEGRFELKLNHRTSDLYSLKIYYIGYAETQLAIDLSTEEDLDLGDIRLEEGLYKMAEMIVLSNTIDDNTPMTVTNLSKSDIRAKNVGVDLPYILEQTPSIVVNSDAGAGVGYTGMRIRGSDATRVNITINGVPFNDSESQGTFLVNIPDFSSSVQSLQIQRGAGTSTNGTGAFGATIALETNQLQREPYAELANSYGSFNTRKHTLQFGSGLIAKHFTVEGRLSHILSDGYIDRATSNLKSYYLSAGFVHKNTAIYANIFSGKEITYQAWGGVPQQYVQDSGRTVAYFGKSDSLRRYNPYTYDNEVDNYAQTHYQLHLKQQLFDRLSFKTTLFYTEGKGYYEQYRSEDDLANYQLDPVALGDTTIYTSDLIRRRWLDNDFYGINYQFNYTQGRWNLLLGGSWSRYLGRHFGEVIWAKYASNGAIRHRYYDNNAEKWDGNTYLKFQGQIIKGLFAYADLQHRYVHYSFLGNDRNLNNEIVPLQMDTTLHFFNPKVGITYHFLSQHRVFASFSVANKEPNREDFTNAIRGQFPKPETLYDLEFGYRFATSWIQASADFYYMYYRNQLVLTGRLNDVGAYIRTNVPQSYRMGMELQVTARPLNWLILSGNFTLSRNKIVQWTEYVDNWDTWSQEAVEHRQTDIAFSPALLGGGEIAFIPFERVASEGRWGHQLNLGWIQKGVGKQYIDNTMNETRSLKAYWTNDIRLSYTLSHEQGRMISLNFVVKNVLNAQYSANAWVYRFRSPSYNPVADDPSTSADAADYYNMIGLYPQAGRHFFVSLLLRI